MWPCLIRARGLKGEQEGAQKCIIDYIKNKLPTYLGRIVIENVSPIQFFF